MRSGQILLAVAAALLAVAACVHAAGWYSLRSEFPDAVQPVVRLLWFSVDLDWLVTASIWAVAAWTGTAALRLPVLAASVIPIGSALWFAATLGPGFIGIYLLALVAVLALVGGGRLGRP
jgi:hypothetical protein